jgi:hypothetical protein
MKHYGIENNGPFIHEIVATLPSWTSADEGRQLYATDVKKYYVGSDSAWILIGGGGSTKDITQNAHTLNVGNVVRYNSGTSLYVLAQADSEANAEVVGIVSNDVSANVFTLLSSGYLTSLSGLTAGSVHYLSETVAGELTTSEPVLLNSINKPLLIADSTTSGFFFNWRGVANTDPSVGYSNAFTSASITAGILTIDHNLGSKYCVPIIWDNNSKVISPDDYTAVTANQMTIDLTSFGTITGTWYITILSAGATFNTGGVTIAANATGFSISGGTSSKTLNVTDDVSIGKPVLTNLLTNSQWMACSGSTVCEVTSGAAPVTDGANAALVNNLLTNGGFDSVTTGWTAENGALSSDAGGKTGNTLTVTNTGVAYGRASQGVTTVIGKLYQFSSWFKKGTASEGYIYIGLAPGGVELYTSGALTDAGFTQYTKVFEATATTTYISCTNNNTDGGTNLYDSITLYEVTPGYVAADALAPDGWVKTSTLDVLRQHNDATYTTDGSFYSLKVTKGANTAEYLYKQFSSLGAFEKFHNRIMTQGSKVYSVTATDNVKVAIYHGGAWTAYASFAGADAWAWQELTATIDPTSTDIRFGWLFDGDTGDVAYVQVPMLVFGSSIGAGNYQPIPNEVIWLQSNVVFRNPATVTGNSTPNLEAVSSGKIGKGIKSGLIIGYASTSAAGSYLQYGNSLLIYSQINGIIAMCGWGNCDVNGDISEGANASWSTVLDIRAIQT